MPKKLLQVLLDEEYDEVQAIAQKEDTSMSAVGRRLIRERLGERRQ